MARTLFKNSRVVAFLAGFVYVSWYENVMQVFQQPISVVIVSPETRIVKTTTTTNPIADVPMTSTTVNSNQQEITTFSGSQGNQGGDWSWCTHVTKYGLNFDLGLASFLADQLQPTRTFEFGAGMGLYAEYLVRHGHVPGDVYGAEPTDMSAAGVFGRTEWPKQIKGNLLDDDRQAERQALGKFDVVYSIEVAEHIPAKLRPQLLQFLSSITGKYLVFSAARPRQGGTGHIPESMLKRHEWIQLWESTGLYHLPRLSEMLRNNCDDWNKNHRINAFVMGVSRDLDTSIVVPLLNRTHNVNDRLQIEQERFPFVKEAIARNIDKCTQ